MSHRFHSDFVGLQIAWADDDEIEFLGPAVLAGASNHTAATCKIGTRLMSYLYPVLVSDTGTQLALTYQRNPERWPDSWEMYQGALTIDFQGASNRVPQSISFKYFYDGHVERLAKGTDWRYQTSNSIKFEPRGRIALSRLARTRQQALRNLLLSEYGQCQITESECTAVLEACHIVPVKNGGDDTVGNALLLRRDLHALFDAGLLQFHPKDDDWQIVVSPTIADRAYRRLNGKNLLLRSGHTSDEYLRARIRLQSPT